MLSSAVCIAAQSDTGWNNSGYKGLVVDISPIVCRWISFVQGRLLQKQLDICKLKKGIDKKLDVGYHVNRIVIVDTSYT